MLASSDGLARPKKAGESKGFGDCAEPVPWEERGGGCRKAVGSITVPSGDDGIDPERRW